MSAVIDAARLIDRLRNNVFEVDPGSRGETDLAYRRGFNAAMQHIETEVIPYLIAEAKVLGCLDELERETR